MLAINCGIIGPRLHGKPLVAAVGEIERAEPPVPAIDKIRVRRGIL